MLNYRHLKCIKKPENPLKLQYIFFYDLWKLMKPNSNLFHLINQKMYLNINSILNEDIIVGHNFQTSIFFSLQNAKFSKNLESLFRLSIFTIS